MLAVGILRVASERPWQLRWGPSITSSTRPTFFRPGGSTGRTLPYLWSSLARTRWGSAGRDSEQDVRGSAGTGDGPLGSRTVEAAVVGPGSKEGNWEKDWELPKQD